MTENDRRYLQIIRMLLLLCMKELEVTEDDEDEGESEERTWPQIESYDGAKFGGSEDFRWPRRY